MPGSSSQGSGSTLLANQHVFIPFQNRSCLQPTLAPGAELGSFVFSSRSKTGHVSNKRWRSCSTLIRRCFHPVPKPVMSPAYSDPPGYTHVPLFSSRSKTGHVSNFNNGHAVDKEITFSSRSKTGHVSDFTTGYPSTYVIECFHPVPKPVMSPT